MKTLYLLVCLLAAVLFSEIAQGQTTYEFTYDASGSRLPRAVIQMKSATIPTDSLEAKQAKKPLDDSVGPQKTRIYPNPTKGLLRIDLPELREQLATIRLYDSNGKLIIQQSAVELNNELNLAAYPTGIYILTIQIGEIDRKEWKIIKE